MANTKGNRGSGCLATVLRHLLCRHGAPMHPTDVAGELGLSPVGSCERIPEERSQLGGGGRDQLGVTMSGRRAGLVARLMGLETLPDVKCVQSVKSPDVFSRSRSVNFMDYLLEVDLSSGRATRHRHRRAKTSVSYHEASVPTSVPTEKEKDFIIVILEDREREEDGQENEMVARPRKHEVRRRKKSECSKEKKVLKLRDEPRTRNRAACDHKSGQAKVSARKSNRKDAGKPVVPAANDGDGSSPVSVLDMPEGRHPQGNNLAMPAPANSSRKSGRSRHESTPTQVATTSAPKTIPERKAAAMEAEVPQEMKLLDDVILQLQSLAEEEATNPSWLPWDTPTREEICRTIEQHSLDCLLEELVMFSPWKSSDTTASGARRRDRSQEV